MYTMLFDVAGLAMIGWALMVLLPGWTPTRALVRSQVFPLGLAAIYAAGVIVLLSETGPSVLRDFGSAVGVTGLLADPRVALVAWIHILAFDHLVAVLIFRDNLRLRIVSLPVQSIILIVTLMFGPIGYLSYCAARRLRGHAPAPPLVGATP